jgi:Flp pilus assembly protein TadD
MLQQMSDQAPAQPAPGPANPPFYMPLQEPAQPQEAAPSTESAELATGRERIWDLPVNQLEQRVAADPMDAEARNALGRKYVTRGDLDRAITVYGQVVRIDPTNSEAHNDLGVAFQARGKRAEAESAYRRAIALDPFSSTAHLNLGLLLRGQNRGGEASQEFFLARQNARGDSEMRTAESASTGAKMDPRLSRPR